MSESLTTVSGQRCPVEEEEEEEEEAEAEAPRTDGGRKRGGRKFRLPDYHPSFASPWSSESTESTSPLPQPPGGTKFKLERQTGFAGSSPTCSLGSSPSTAAGTGPSSLCSSLTVPEPQNFLHCLTGSGASPSRSPSPFNFKARVRRRKEKRLEKQQKQSLPSGAPADPQILVASNPSGADHGAPAATGCWDHRGQQCLPHQQQGQGAPGVAAPDPDKAAQPIKASSSNAFRFKDFRKRSKESLSFRRSNRSSCSHRSETPADFSVSSSLPSSQQLLTAAAAAAGPGGSCSGSVGQFGPNLSPEARSPRSPISPGQCRCRRCSLLPLEECEPKEMSALFKFLRKSKV